MEERQDLISRQAAIDAVENEMCIFYDCDVLEKLKELPPAQPNLQPSCNQLATDCISRQAAIDALKEHRALFCDNTPDTFSKLSYGEKCRVDELDTAISTLVDLPPAQPTQTDASNTLKALDCVERQAAIDAANDWLLDCLKIQKQDRSCGLIRRLEDLPSARPELRWIPCSPETMPKKTGYYLVQYTRKYCRKEMAVAFYSVKEARCDDDYTWEIETFSDIKEVIAWRPLPEPYREEGGE